MKLISTTAALALVASLSAARRASARSSSAAAAAGSQQREAPQPKVKPSSKAVEGDRRAADGGQGQRFCEHPGESSPPPRPSPTTKEDHYRHCAVSS